MAKSKECSRCGADLPPGTPGGHCPKCLLGFGLAFIEEIDGPGAEIDVPDSSSIRTDEKPGKRIKPYQLVRQIGEGGMGIVWLAEQLEPVRRTVALKIVKLGMDTKRVAAQFQAECQALALMDHPNIAKVLDAGTTETGRPYLVMELVAGTKITGYSDQHELPVRQRLMLFIQVCQAVQHAHQKGILHRDIKPSNILVVEQDGAPIPKVIDFGIAKAITGQRLTDKTTLFTAFEQFLGTPAYMSPEQAGLGWTDIDTRSDIYSLGVLLYELLAGQPPFDATELKRATLGEILQTIRDKDPPPPSTKLAALPSDELNAVALCRRSEPKKLPRLVHGDLDWIVMKALEKDRDRRYETAVGLARDVERHLKGEPVVARPTGTAYRLKKLFLRNQLACLAFAAVAVTLVLGIIVSSTEALQARREAQVAAAKVIEAKNTLVAFNFAEANRLIQTDDGPDAVPYLLKILSVDPENGAALMRLATLLTYHSWMIPTLTVKQDRWVLSASFSPSGERMLAVFGNSAEVWNAHTGRPTGGVLQHQDRILYAGFSPDGSRVITASQDSTARVWDAQTGQPLTDPLIHAGPVIHAEFSPDGHHIATASEDGTARLWDAQTGKPLFAPLRHRGPVNFIQFSPDGKRVATASQDGTARIWDALTGQPLNGPIRHQGPVCMIQFSPDSRRVVTASWDDTARIWDASTGEQLTMPLKHGDQVLTARFSPDGRTVVTASRDNTARVWDAQTGQPRTGPLEHTRDVNSAEFSPDGRRIITASLDNTAKVWDAWTGEPSVEPLQHSGAIWSAHFSPDGRRIVTASADNTARIWDLITSPPFEQLLKHDGEVKTAQFSPDGKRIVTASYDRSSCIWDVQSGRLLLRFPYHMGAVKSAWFSPDGTRVVTASDDHTACIWDVQTGRMLTPPLRHARGVLSAQFSPDGRRILTASGTLVQVWDAQTGRPLTRPLNTGSEVAFAQFSPDGKNFVLAIWGNSAIVGDAVTGLPVAWFLKHTRPVAVARFSPDSKRVVTGSADGTAWVWDSQTGTSIAGPMQHADYVLDAEFSCDGTRVVTASRDNSARIWDARTGLPLTEPLKHQKSVEFAQFSPDGRYVITASADGTAWLWDSQTGLPLAEPFRHQSHLYSAQFSPDGRRIVTACRGSTARVWDVGFVPSRCPAWLPQLAEALCGNRLNQQGMLEPSTLDRAQIISRIRQYLNTQPDSGDGVRWGRWLLADPSTRTISPLSITFPTYLNNEMP